MTDPRLSLAAAVGADAAGPVLDALDRIRPVIRVGASIDPVAATAAGALYSLLRRVFPHTVIVGDAMMGPNPWSVTTIRELPGRLSAVRPAPTRPHERDLVVAVGADIDEAELWLGGDDWTVDVGRRPRPARGCRFGIGLQAAAVLVAAEISKLALGPLGMVAVSFGDELVWNLLDYRLAPAIGSPGGPLTSLKAVWFGTGSVGSSAAGVAACVEELVGVADTVDGDSFDSSRNPFRYPVSVGTETGSKAIWVASLLGRAGWDANPLVGSVGNWVSTQDGPGFDGIAVSSVDRVDSRLQVADVLARTTLTVGVAGLALHIQREHSFDDSACPQCQYVSLAPPMSQVEVIASQVGLPAARVARLHIDGEPLSAEDVAAVVAAGKLGAEGAGQLIGRRVDDLVRRAYAEASVPKSGGGETTGVAAPYVSWMGGVLIAAELIKAAAGLPMVDRRVDLDLSGVPLGVVRRRPRDTSGHCICALPTRRRWAARLYGGSWHQTTNYEQAST